MWRGWLVSASAVGVLLGGPAVAWAAPRLAANVPNAALAGARVSVTGAVRVRASAVMLEVRRGRRWSVVARARVQVGGRFSLAWRAPGRPGRVVVRVAASAGRGVLAASRAATVSVSSGPPRGHRVAVLHRAAAVVSLPSPGAPGTVVLDGGVPARPGQVLAVGYSRATPYGFLGLVLATGRTGSRTIVQTRPATLQEAGANGTLDLSRFREVAAAADSRAGAGARPRGGRHATAAAASSLGHALAENITCTDGASASINGSVSVSVTPALHAHFSLLHGLTSADFSLTGRASASLTAHAEASAGCELKSTPILTTPLHLATFEGAIGPVPVVVVLQGQVYLDGKLSDKATFTTGVSATARMTGGISYRHGHGFSPKWNGPNASFTFDPPAINANASAQVNVEPALQMLLYGVGGPQLGVKGGLDFEADTTKSPWWTLDAPMSVEASLNAPDLDLESGALTLYGHTFHVADSGTPPPPSGSGGTGGTNPSPPFNECPAVDASPSCAILIVIAPNGQASLLEDPSVGPYDSNDDTLVGVLNQSSTPVRSLPLTGAGIFDFDGDGLCDSGSPPAGCPFGSSGYEGPGTVLTADPSGTDSGTISFPGGLAPGTSTYLTLEGPPTSLVAQPPSVTTGSASAIYSDSATLNGTLDPNGADTTYYFEYGTDTSYGSQSDSNTLGASPSDKPGSGSTPVQADIGGLDPNATYHYRLVATNAKGTAYGADQTFTTTS